MARLFGDDMEASRKARVQADVTPGAIARLVIDLAGRDLPLLDRVGLFARLAIRGKSIGVGGMTAHCELGSRRPLARPDMKTETRLAAHQAYRFAFHVRAQHSGPCRGKPPASRTIVPGGV